MEKPLSPGEFTRLANNFYNLQNVNVDYGRISLDSYLLNYVAEHRQDVEKKSKVALCCICVNPTYWEYAKGMIEGARQYFLPGHNVDMLFWTDMPKIEDEAIFVDAEKHILEAAKGVVGIEEHAKEAVKRAKEGVLVATQNATIFPIEPIEWPYPTLMRYHTFLQQEEKLKEYDYVFYCDIDMVFAGIVGDEILSEELTAAQHPMYALDKMMWPPYEPNIESTAHIKRPGMIISDNGQPRFMPLYFAGGFQGGKTEHWITAMKEMRKMIDKDALKNYIAIWNDESYWNKYLFENPPTKVLTPSYIYPDSLINEYYKPRWGCDYPPKIITLTKKHTLKKIAPEDAEKLRMMK